MKNGYSFQIAGENIGLLERAGMPRLMAIRHAMNHARKCFFKAHPRGAIPEWMAYPKKYRLREHYNEQGEPLRRNPVGRLPRHAAKRGSAVARQIPAQKSELRRAAKLYADFSGHTDLKAQKINVPGMPKTMLAIGYIDGVMYSTVRDGVAEKYVHHFARNSRPLFTVSPDGKQLFMLGGAYNFTERGIVDKKSRSR